MSSALEMTVGFAGGGIGKWTWAGGISIDEAEEPVVHTADQEEESSMKAIFLEEILAGSNAGEQWRADVAKSLDALRISLGAEEAFAAGSRVSL